MTQDQHKATLTRLGTQTSGLAADSSSAEEDRRFGQPNYGHNDPNIMAEDGSVVPRTVPSTSAERIVNNVMRHEYRVLTDQEKKQMQMIKDLGLHFHDVLVAMEGPDQVGRSRELSIAKTKIEEAVMWAVKHLTK